MVTLPHIQEAIFFVFAVNSNKMVSIKWFQCLEQCVIMYHWTVSGSNSIAWLRLPQIRYVLVPLPLPKKSYHKQSWPFTLKAIHNRVQFIIYVESWLYWCIIHCSLHCNDVNECFEKIFIKGKFLLLCRMSSRYPELTILSQTSDHLTIQCQSETAPGGTVGPEARNQTWHGHSRLYTVYCCTSVRFLPLRCQITHLYNRHSPPGI